MTSLVTSTPLDDFLNESTSSTETGELLQQVGLFGSVVGITLTVGLLVLLIATLRGTTREIAVILRVVAVGGVLAAVGAAIELAGVASIGSLSWSDALTDGTGSAPMIRLLAGLMIVLGMFEHTVPVDDEHDADTNAGDSGADHAGDDATDHEPADDGDRADDRVGAGRPTPLVRWVPASASAFGLAGAVLGVISFWFDGHTVSEGPRVLHALVDTVHVSAGSVWFGGVIGLVVIGLLRRSSPGTPVAPDIIRFSTVASIALILVALAGSVMTLFVIDGFGDLTATDWGRLLLVKTAAVGLTALIGGYNHFVVVPTLERSSDPQRMIARARLTLAVEAVVLIFVLALTVLLTTASIN